MTQLTHMKLISMTCEHSVAQRTIDLLREKGVRSVRTSAIRIEEFGADSSVDLHESQLKLEFLVHPDQFSPLLSELTRRFLSRFDVGFYTTDAHVLRPEIFCDSETSSK
jgi:hypothetical protein